VARISTSATRRRRRPLEVTARVELIEVDGRRLVFAVEAHDGST
jgi:hypothetical protein